MSKAFALSHSFTVEKMNPPMVVHTPIGHCHTSKIVPKTIVEIEGIEFLASPIILKCSTIDLILGMDWLKIHDAALYCGNKSVRLFRPSDGIAETQIYMMNALKASPLDGIENIPIIRDFPDV